MQGMARGESSITTRIIGLLVATVAAVYGGLVLLFSLLGSPLGGARFAANPLAEVRSIVERIRAENLLDPARRRDLDALLAGYRDSRVFFRLSVIDRRLTVIASTEEALRDTPEPDAFVRHAFERGRTYPTKTRYGSIDVEQEAHPIVIAGTVEAVLLAARYVEGDLGELAPVAAPRVSVRLFLLLCLFFVIVMAFYVYRFFRRLSDLSGAVSNLARGDYRARIPLSPDSELGVLAESFNRIAEDKERQARETTLLNRVLEQSNREKERHLRTLAQVAGGMAHEVRNPLGGIRGFAELLKLELEKAGTPADDKRFAYVESILGEVRALETLVQSVLDFARPKMPAFAPTPVDILIETVRPTLERRALDLAERGIRVEQSFELAPDLPAVDCDPGQMRQLLLNLSLNAHEAMEETGGRFTLAARRARPEERALLPPGIPAERPVVAFEIRDTGEGMDAETRENLFTPFHTTKARGTGLGLPVCRKIVEIHGGAIRVESEKGRGSVFTVVLPAERERR